MLLALAGTGAWAQSPYPLDIELVRPALSGNGLFAVDVAGDEPGTWVFGAPIQYVRDPLRLYDNDEPSSVIGNRVVMHLGGSTALTKELSLGATLPVAVHTAGEVDLLSANGVGTGDLAVTMRLTVADKGPWTAGGLLTAYAPTGTAFRYMGEQGPRASIGALGAYELDRLMIGGNAYIHTRAPVRTAHDLVAGTELWTNAGLRYRFDDNDELITEWINRVNLSPERSGARWSAEVLAGIRHTVSDKARLDLMVGRGLAAGYGSSALRVVLGVTFIHVVPEPEPEPDDEVVVVVVEKFLDDLQYEDPPDPPPPPPEPIEVSELARVEAEEIIITDPVKFDVDTARIRDESLPVLQAVATLINGNGAIGHVVIEGHASAEGTHEYNYALSVRRAAAIWEALVREGVHPNRMSYRGMGEVAANEAAEDGQELAQDRKVVFHIVRQYAPGEETPPLPSQIRLPWNGQPHTAETPPPPMPPPAPAPDLIGDDEPEAPLDAQPEAEPAPETPAPPPEPSPEPPAETPAPQPDVERWDVPDDEGPTP